MGLLSNLMRVAVALAWVLFLHPSVAQGQDNAASFDGAGDYLYAGNLTPGASFTFEAWTRFDSVSTAQTIVAAASLTDSLNAFYLGYFANTGEWIVELDDDDPYEADDCASANTLCVPTSPTQGALLHVAVVVQGIQMTLFFDGVEVGTETAATPPSFGSDAWVLGAETDAGVFGTDAFVGLLDEVRVWSVARSGAEILCTKDWALTGNESGLYARWSMNEGPFSIAALDSAGSFDASIFGDPEFIGSPFGLTQSTGGDIPCLNVDGDQDGFTLQDGDCDDDDAGINPGALEICNGLDDDCDGVIDEGLDLDQDGFLPCGDDVDCDDQDGTVYPGAAELCDGVDTDCDGALPVDEEDEDADSWTLCAGDCDDTDPLVNPGIAEFCNGKDDNCDDQIGGEELDSDGDGYRPCSGDCDDTNAQMHPAATEDCSDGLDNDCDGLSDQTDPDCAGDDDDAADDDDAGDDDDSWLPDDDDSADEPVVRRDGCDCGDGVTGGVGLSYVLVLGLLAPRRRRGVWRDSL